jgi:hypothetical protein
MTKYYSRSFVVIAVAFLLQGCTTRAWYDGLQHSARQACLGQPSSEQARCEARLNRQDFDSYEKQRASNKTQ